MLYGGYVDVVDGGEVKDDGFEGWAVGVQFWGFAAAWAGVVPRCLLVFGMRRGRRVRTKDGHLGVGSDRGLFGG